MAQFSLISVNFALVARDIAYTLQQFDLGMPQVTPAREEAVAWLSQLAETDMVRLAVIQASPEDFVASDLYQRLAKAGSQVILLVDSLEEAARSTFPALVVPFFTEDLEALVAQLACAHKSGRSGGVS